MDNRTTRTDPRIIRTRQLLKDAFVDLLQEMDIEKISVNRIAERATINRVTFYLHYKDIPDMMDKMADEMIEEINQSLGQADNKQELGDEADWPILVCLLQHIAEHAKFYKVILASKRIPIFTERFMKLLTRLITERVQIVWEDSSIEEAGIQKEIAIWYGSSALIGTIVGWLRSDMPYTPHYLAKQFYLIRTYSNKFL